MKILLIADEESPYLWDYYLPGKLADIDLILSCGDLKPDYLSFLVTMSTAPLLYIHGNHDGKYATRPPEGCECIEDKVININGVRILGLGGCVRYSPGPHQYTEKEMEKRIRKLRFQLWKSHGVDIVISHAPVKSIGDENTHTHCGFQAFYKIVDKYKPKLWAYGHVHLGYGKDIPRLTRQNDTVFINANERYTVIFDTDTKQILLPGKA